MSVFSQYSPLNPHTTFVEGLQWISLDGPIAGLVSPNAKFNNLPLKRLDDWDLDLGCPRVVDWAVFADWYERKFHWRGWIPTGAIGGDIIPRPSASMLPRDPMLKPLQGEDVLPAATLEAMVKLNTLRASMLKLLPEINRFYIPIPGELDLSLLRRVYRDSRRLLTDLCRSCYHMLDLVGFFRWAARVFEKELNNPKSGKTVTELYKWFDRNFNGKSIGYLIHLDAHRREFRFRFCIDEGVPFYYPWLDAYTVMPWLRRFDPNSLGFNPEKGPPPTDFSPYDQYLQNVVGQNNRTVEISGLPRRTPYIVDFEGWIRRPLRIGERPSVMCNEYYWEDVIRAEGSACIRFYHLWRKKQLAEVDEQCDSRGHTPLHPDIIRERYKFKCAPCENDVYDSMLYQGSLDCSRRSQIRPKLPFGAEPEPSRLLDQTPNPLDSATSSKKSVVPMKPVHVSTSVPMDIGLSAARSSAFVPMGGSRPNGNTSSQRTKSIGPSPSDHLSTSPASGAGSLAPSPLVEGML